jgi:hypothetical protein
MSQDVPTCPRTSLKMSEDVLETSRRTKHGEGMPLPLLPFRCRHLNPLGSLRDSGDHGYVQRARSLVIGPRIEPVRQPAPRGLLGVLKPRDFLGRLGRQHLSAWSVSPLAWGFWSANGVESERAVGRASTGRRPRGAAGEPRRTQGGTGQAGGDQAASAPACGGGARCARGSLAGMDVGETAHGRAGSNRSVTGTAGAPRGSGQA